MVVLWWSIDTLLLETSTWMVGDAGLCLLFQSEESHEFCPRLTSEMDGSKTILAINWLHAETQTFVLRFGKREQSSSLHLSTISVLHLSSKCKHLRKKSAMPERYSEQSRNQSKTSLDKAPRRKLYSTFNCWVNSFHSIKITGNNLDVRFT